MVSKTNYAISSAPGMGPGALPAPASPEGSGEGRWKTPLGVEPILPYVAAVTASGILLVVWLILTHRFAFAVPDSGSISLSLGRPLLFTAFVLVGELVSLTVARGSDTAEVTTSPTFAFGLLLGWGVGWATTALVASAVTADLVRRKQFRKVFFNAGQYALAIGTAGIVYRALGGTSAIRLEDLLPVLAAATAFLLVNFTLMAIAIGLTQGVSVREYVKHNFLFTTWVTGVLLSMSPVVVVLAQYSPILLPLLALPLGAVYMGVSASLKNTRLRELNQLKDDFVAMVSHELRTPLTSIQGSVKTLIQLGRDLDEEQRLSFLEAVDRQSDRLRRLIERLLVVARLEADAERVSLSPVPLRTLCEYVVFELRPAAGSHSFQFDFEPELVEVETDEGKVHQILSNLAENALKYSRTDSRITIRCRAESDAILLMVEDQGPGIPGEAQERIFDRFYQVDQSKTRHVGGTGLGLYICRKLAEAIGGQLSLDGEYDGGCRFVLRIPRRSSKRSAPQADLAVRQLPKLVSGNGHAMAEADSAPEDENEPAVISGSQEVTRGRVVAFMTKAAD